MAVTVYLVDKSVWELRRHTEVADKLLHLTARGLVACCEMVALEMTFSARNREQYETIHGELRALRWLPVTGEVTDRALAVQRILAQAGAHRLPIPDLIIAATGEVHSATVLHNDKDFETIAAVTGQPAMRIAEFAGRADD